MNIFQEAYNIEKKALNGLGQEEYLHFMSVKTVLTAQFLQMYGLGNRYKEFLQKFSDKVKDCKSDEKI